MKILLINTYDWGGAAKSCKRLHLGLELKDIDSKILLKIKQNNWPKSSAFLHPSLKLSTPQKVKYKLKRILKELNIYASKQQRDVGQDFLSNRDQGLELFSFPNSDVDITQSELYKKADIVNLHWVANFLDYQSFFRKNTKPVVWTLHDMNPFSGGEHYLEEYLGIDESGFPIRREWSKEEEKVERKIIEIKKQVMSYVDNLTIVAPSEWLADKARNSEVFKGKPVLCIHNGVNSKIYSPRDQGFSRDLLNIPKGKKIILFVADSISDNRKGFKYLKRAFQQLTNTNIILCAIGKKNSELNSIDNIFELGPIYDDRLMSIAYSAADVFVIPSLMDNLPNTVLESLMCGTPVIGFPVGGIPEMIQDGENGFLTEEISVESLKSTLSKFLMTENNFDRRSIRENAVKKYDQLIQATNYIELFKNIFYKSKESK
jgi:glycosyltransferase involved in cell wall biosynthesis